MHPGNWYQNTQRWRWLVECCHLLCVFVEFYLNSRVPNPGLFLFNAKMDIKQAYSEGFLESVLEIQSYSLT